MSKLDENYKLANPKSSMSPRYKDHEENYFKAHYSKIAQEGDENILNTVRRGKKRN